MKAAYLYVTRCKLNKKCAVFLQKYIHLLMNIKKYELTESHRGIWMARVDFVKLTFISQQIYKFNIIFRYWKLTNSLKMYNI